MLDGTISQTGCIWHQVQLAVLANGHPHIIPFLVCPIGNTPAILGMTWLTMESPLIDWQQGLVTFPEQVQIASNTPAILGMTWLTMESPLIDWQQGLVTFPEQVQIASKEEADPDPLVDLPPQYHEFAKALKQHIDEELATGNICPSTSSAGAPVMQDNLMAKLRHAKIFTKLDLRWGYNNVWIKEGNE
ncbi:Retrotransposable element Tf2 protein [Rhizoctonia solani]|uniref:Retrotransposable element Tf2 protein n=1 Tax=Rhizoctonia solani TaxID=456999 RepID=A0A8H8SZG9_9AGAM|nr:Retrotransposable element Tf2 protein [Rhizoctonia solani]QRW22617.1 Retrotransposable element Tf2 protein [Rhizoctonia solani]